MLLPRRFPAVLRPGGFLADRIRPEPSCQRADQPAAVATSAPAETPRKEHVAALARAVAAAEACVPHPRVNPDCYPADPDDGDGDDDPRHETVHPGDSKDDDASAERLTSSHTSDGKSGYRKCPCPESGASRELRGDLSLVHRDTKATRIVLGHAARTPRL